MKTIATICLTSALAGFGLATTSAAGIPEPPLVIYGQVLDNTTGTMARITSGTLSWTWKSEPGGNAVVLTTTLTNLNDQFSYVLFVPCESGIPGAAPSPNTLWLSQPNITYSRTDATWNGEELVLRDVSQELLTFSPDNRGFLQRMDLGLGAFPDDIDGDGLPDWWEMHYFGTLDYGPEDDPDEDGLNNRGEFIAGSDPTDPKSSLRFVSVTEEPNGEFTIEWSSMPGRYYSILRSPTLSTDPSDYEVIWSGAGTEQAETTAVRDTPPPGHWFYRVRVAQ